MTQIVLLAHGSPDPRSGIAMHGFAKKIQSAINVPTALAFLDHEEPNLMNLTRDENPAQVLVVPMLLSNAFHARFDVPRALLEAGINRVLPPIGNPVKILSGLIQNAGSHVMVVSAGSSDSKARQNFREAVKIASEGLGSHVETAFVTGPESTIETRLRESQNPAEVTIIPWLLAEGRLLDVVLTQAIQHGANVQGNGLVEEDAFINYLSSTIQLFLRSELYPRPTMAR